MTTIPTEADLTAALRAAGDAHHEYETNYLDGVRDEMWPGFYAAYALGRLGPFAAPTALARWLEEVPLEGDWWSAAPRLVRDRLSG